jgi:hypothetical protein
LLTALQLYQHIHDQSCDFTSEEFDAVTRENMCAVKVTQNFLCSASILKSNWQILAERLLHDPNVGFIKL